ncbi:MAG TPA: hypothetical protein VGJ48_03520 [Pyrinomonadaceae bacterium]|nr:hypothetical protein [Blastocatellia bacterium]
MAALDASIGHPDMAEFARLTHAARSFAELQAKTLKEKMLAEMLEEMVSVIEANSQRNGFVFARKL